MKKYSGNQKLNLDRNYIFPTDSAPNGIHFVTNSVGKGTIETIERHRQVLYIYCLYAHRFQEKKTEKNSLHIGSLENYIYEGY